VPIDNNHSATVSGALMVSGGKAIIAASGSVSSGERTTEVVLPRRGILRVCALTTVKLAAGASAHEGEPAGVLMAFDHGALELSFANQRGSDTLLTPYFRLLIDGPGSAEIKVRLGSGGDTCIDNAASHGAGIAPNVTVASVFEGGSYRVQAGQHVMLQHGSLREIVDNEKEPCGCPPPVKLGSNEFPLAQSEGLAPGATRTNASSAPASGALTYNGNQQAQPMTPVTQSATATTTPAQKKPGVFSRIGGFFRRIFGAE
jgi:hypothetical protein